MLTEHDLLEAARKAALEVRNEDKAPWYKRFWTWYIQRRHEWDCKRDRHVGQHWKPHSRNTLSREDRFGNMKMYGTEDVFEGRCKYCNAPMIRKLRT